MTSTERGEFELPDETRIHEVVMALPVAERVAFAAACSELLFPIYAWFVSMGNRGDADLVREAIDWAWASAEAEPAPRDDAERLREAVEGLVPNDDDDDWSLLSPLAQNATASAAYALRAWLSDRNEVMDAVWAARQAIEAADYLVQLGAPAQTYDVTTGAEQPVALVARAIGSALEAASAGSITDLRSAAIGDGVRLLRFVDQTG